MAGWLAGWLSVLYYRGVFIASISDAVSSHPVSPGLCTHTRKKEKSKEGRVGEYKGKERGREVREQSDGGVL